MSGWLRSVLILSLLGGLWSAYAGAQETDEEAPLAERPEVTEPTDACPCFDPTELAELPGSKWDLCLESKSTIQVSRWFGKRTPEGREGFNVIATQASARTMGGSCLLLQRFRVEGVLEQIHSRILDLPPTPATACFEMLKAWLATRGGCESEVAEPSEPAD